MVDNEAKPDDNPLWSALEKESDLELEWDRISWQKAVLTREQYDAEAEGDTDRVATLTRQIRELTKRQRALYRALR